MSDIIEWLGGEVIDGYFIESDMEELEAEDWSDMDSWSEEAA